MLTTTNASVLTAPAPVIPVNLIGAMGRGLALAARERWTGLQAFYLECLRDGRLNGRRDGRNTAIAVYCNDSRTRVILAPTKTDWRLASPIALVRATIQRLGPAAESAGTDVINLPPIGCGLGGLDPDDVAPYVGEAAARYPEIEWTLQPLARPRGRDRESGRGRGDDGPRARRVRVTTTGTGSGSTSTGSVPSRNRNPRKDLVAAARPANLEGDAMINTKALDALTMAALGHRRRRARDGRGRRRRSQRRNLRHA